VASAGRVAKFWTVTADDEGRLCWGDIAVGAHPTLRSREGLLVVPVAAVTIDGEGSIVGQVMRATFAEGRHRIEVDVEGVPAGEETVVIEHASRLERGATVGLSVALDSVIAVASAG